MVTVMMMGANKDLSEEAAYALTKSFFDNLDAMKSANALLTRLNTDAPFAGAICRSTPARRVITKSKASPFRTR